MSEDKNKEMETLEAEQDFTQEEVNQFMESLNEHDRAIFDDIIGGVYAQGKEAGKRDVKERTTFCNPYIMNIGQVLLEEETEELEDSYREGMKIALKYAGMVNILASVGVSMEAIETIVINDMAIKGKEEIDSYVDEEDYIDKESMKF